MARAGTRVLGDFRSKPCLRKAGGLIYDSYGRDGSQVHPDLRPWINAAWETWERPTGSDIMDDPSGFHARFYRPKEADPDAPGYCPPVLAFRGSEVTAHDVRDLAGVLRIQVGFDSNRFLSRREAFLDALGAVGGLLTHGYQFLLMSSEDPNTPYETKLARANALPHRRPIADVAGRTTVRVRNPFNVGDMILGAEEIALTYRITLTLHFGDGGDWSTNITQGMGEPAEQYRLAAEKGREFAQEAMTKFNGRVIFTGHSLGGGLAAMAAIAGKTAHRDCFINTVTYNAAGVHESTARRYAEGAALSQNPTTRNYSVADELLTTLQIHQSKMPLVTPIIRWANVLNPGADMGLRPARNDSTVEAGISPGSSKFNQLFAHAYDPLPKLWPISENTVAQAQVALRDDPRTAELVAQQSASRAALDARYDELEARRMEALRHVPVDMVQVQQIDLQIDALSDELVALEESGAWENHVPVFPDVSNTGNFPILTELDALARRCSSDDFVAGLVGFLLTGQIQAGGGGTFELNLGNLRGARARAEQLMNEGRGMAPIAAAAVLYHTFDPCAFTFHNPRSQ